MAWKGTQSVKVYEASGTIRRLPQIRLQGKWLQELGFDIGSALNVFSLNILSSRSSPKALTRRAVPFSILLEKDWGAPSHAPISSLRTRSRVCRP